jgi:hypothetical protein
VPARRADLYDAVFAFTPVALLPEFQQDRAACPGPSSVWGRRPFVGVANRAQFSRAAWAGPGTPLSAAPPAAAADGRGAMGPGGGSSFGGGPPPPAIPAAADAADAANRRFHEQQKRNARDARLCFDEMFRRVPPGGRPPSVRACNALLRVYTNARWVGQAEKCVARFREGGVRLDVHTHYALIEMYCGVRNAERALALLQEAEAVAGGAGDNGMVFARAASMVLRALARDGRHGERLHMLRALHARGWLLDDARHRAAAAGHAQQQLPAGSPAGRGGQVQL